MEFNNQKAIYLQIVDRICERVLLGQMLPGDPLPSVRAMAKALNVNPNTVMKAYEVLHNLEISYLKRGQGYYIAPEGKAHALQSQREDLIQNEMSTFMQHAYRVGIGPEELVQYYHQFNTPGCSDI